MDRFRLTSMLSGAVSSSFRRRGHLHSVSNASNASGQSWSEPHHVGRGGKRYRQCAADWMPSGNGSEGARPGISLPAGVDHAAKRLVQRDDQRGTPEAAAVHLIANAIVDFGEAILRSDSRPQEVGPSVRSAQIAGPGSFEPSAQRSAGPRPARVLKELLDARYGQVLESRIPTLAARAWLGPAPSALSVPENTRMILERCSIHWCRASRPVEELLDRLRGERQGRDRLRPWGCSPRGRPRGGSCTRALSRSVQCVEAP